MFRLHGRYLASSRRTIVGFCVLLLAATPACRKSSSPASLVSPGVGATQVGSAVAATPAVADAEMARLSMEIEADTPTLSRADSYVGSAACVSCHPSEHASWHKTYHRTMTQLALPGNVQSDFAETTVASAGIEYRVFRRGNEFWAEMPDPDRMLDMSRGDPTVVPEELPRVERRVLMTTGSHHYQTFWVGHSQLDTVLNTLPLVYLPAEDRWIPREAAFMSPPDQPHRMITIWNDHCINCHSTGGNPGLKGPKTLATAVGELGISCEACHGPGENHVAHHSNQSLNVASNSKPKLAHPAQLDHKRSSQICGQCHGVFLRLGEQGMKFAREGIQFVPGEDLHAKRFYPKFPDENAAEREKAAFQQNRAFFRERWWDDGTMLAAGREYSAMLRTSCYVKGEMSCLSCHSMHNSEPNDQLADGMRGNQACTSCHSGEQFSTNISLHTHHATGSSGSECMNCHMPHTSYALFSATRNHTITSPGVRNSVADGVPNACNLCHLDKTLGWTQNRLADWYDHPKLPLSPHQQQTSAAVDWLLRGHAAQRIVTAWHFGWPAAQGTASTDWMVPVLSQLLQDPYGVVRHVAEQSLRTLLTDEALEYDFLADQQHFADSIQRLRTEWHSDNAVRRTASEARSVLLRVEGDRTVDAMWDEIDSLVRQRDNRPVTIKE